MNKSKTGAPSNQSKANSNRPLHDQLQNTSSQDVDSNDDVNLNKFDESSYQSPTNCGIKRRKRRQRKQRETDSEDSRGYVEIPRAKPLNRADTECKFAFSPTQEDKNLYCPPPISSSNSYNDSSSSDSDSDSDKSPSENNGNHNSSIRQQESSTQQTGSHDDSEKVKAETKNYFEDFTRLMFTQALSRHLEDIVSADETIPNSKDPPSIFFSISKPSISIDGYVHRLVTYTHCSPTVFIVALILLERVSHYQSTLSLSCVNLHRLLITSITIGVKLLDHRTFSMAHYAKVGGVPSKHEMLRLELKFLKFIHYNSFIDSRSYDMKLNTLRTIHNEMKSNNCQDISNQGKIGNITISSAAPTTVDVSSHQHESRQHNVQPKIDLQDSGGCDQNTTSNKVNYQFVGSRIELSTDSLQKTNNSFYDTNTVVSRQDEKYCSVSADSSSTKRKHCFGGIPSRISVINTPPSPDATSERAKEETMSKTDSTKKNKYDIDS